MRSRWSDGRRPRGTGANQGRDDRQSASHSLDCAWDCRLLGFVLPVARTAQTPGLISLCALLETYSAGLAKPPYRFGRSPDWLKMKSPAAPAAVKSEAEED